MGKQYSRTTWLNQLLSGNPLYQLRDDSGNIIYNQAQINLISTILQSGTPMNAANLNNIEAGLDALDSQVNLNGIGILRETGGPTALALGSIPDGYFSRRSGSSFIGALPDTQFISLNNTASTIPLGGIVVWDSSADSAVKTTAILGDPSIKGVALASIAPGVSGRFAASGQHTIAVTGNVTRGHRLIASSTPGYAMDSGYTQRGSLGDLGIAETAFTGSTGTVIATLDIHPYASSNNLQQLNAASPIYAEAAAATLSTTILIDSGADLLVLAFAGERTGNYTTQPTTIQVNGTSVDTIYAVDEYYFTTAGITVGSGIAVMRNPPQGNGLSLSFITPGNSEIKVTGITYIGSQASPLRTRDRSAIAAGATTDTLNPTSAAGDIIVDVSALYTIANVWTPGTGQTTQKSDTSPTPLHLVTTKPGIASATPMTVAGATNWGGHTAVAIRSS